MSGAPFTGLARAQTALRDFDRLRKAIRTDHDIEAAEAALDQCERWFSCIDPNALATARREARAEALGNVENPAAALAKRISEDGDAMRVAVNAMTPILRADMGQSAWNTVSEMRAALIAALEAIEVEDQEK